MSGKYDSELLSGLVTLPDKLLAIWKQVDILISKNQALQI